MDGCGKLKTFRPVVIGCVLRTARSFFIRNYAGPLTSLEKYSIIISPWPWGYKLGKPLKKFLFLLARPLRGRGKGRATKGLSGWATKKIFFVAVSYIL